MMIACPTAWIDTPRSESIGPVHNSMTPVDELDPAGITVALGTDNVCDAMVPWNGGDMWHELMTLATAAVMTKWKPWQRLRRSTDAESSVCHRWKTPTSLSKSRSVCNAYFFYRSRYHG